MTRVFSRGSPVAAAFSAILSAIFSAIFIAIFIVALLPARVSAHSGLETGAEIGFNEKLGSVVPLDATFTGEDGGRVAMRDLVKRPTLLVLAYYRCKNECNALLVGLARGLRDTRGTAGLDYQVVTVSINDVETPKDALAKKRMSLASIEKPFPDSGWRFLVGDDTNIDALADSIGFSYRRNGEDFDHPLGAIVLSPEGKIVRYMIGPDFLAVDINMSLMEASAGLVRPTIAKMLRFCVSYDPNKKQFGFDVLRVSGIVTTILVACLAIVLVRSGAKRRRAGQGSPR